MIYRWLKNYLPYKIMAYIIDELEDVAAVEGVGRGWEKQISQNLKANLIVVFE